MSLLTDPDWFILNTQVSDFYTYILLSHAWGGSGGLMKRGRSGLLPCFIGLAFIRAPCTPCTPCLQLTCRAAEWPAGTKGGFSRGYLWSNGRAGLSNRPWPLTLSSTPEVHSSGSLCSRCASESAPLSPTAEHISRPHMRSGGGFYAAAANQRAAQSPEYYYFFACFPPLMSRPMGAWPRTSPRGR